MINFETGIDATVEADADGEDGNGQPLVASGVGRSDQCNSRPELADAVYDLSCDSVIESSGRYHPIGHVRDHHREYPHGKVRQRRDNTVLRQNNNNINYSIKTFRANSTCRPFDFF